MKIKCSELKSKISSYQKYEDGPALPPHCSAAVHDEDVGGEAEDVGRVERQVLVVGTAAGGQGGVLANQ